MPVARTRRSASSIIQTDVTIPPALPRLPADALDRFPSLERWQADMNEWWGVANSAIQDGQREISAEIARLGKNLATLTEQFNTFRTLMGRLVVPTSVATGAGTTTLTAASGAIWIFTGTSTQTVQLPPADCLGVGVAVLFTIKNRSTGAVTIAGDSGELIDGAASLILLTLDSATLTSDGASGWNII